MAEHSFLATFIGYVLAQMLPDVNQLRLLQMCLLHDLTEARTGDLNYVQKKYVTADESKVMADLMKNIPFGPAINALLEEFNMAKTIEAQLARDADQLALILELRALQDAGNDQAGTWLPHVATRVRTEAGRKLAKTLLETASDAWWFEEKGHPPR